MKKVENYKGTNIYLYMGKYVMKSHSILFPTIKSIRKTIDGKIKYGKKFNYNLLNNN